MNTKTGGSVQDVESYLREHEHKRLLRFLTCGSVDDGKSTLIGRLLYDTKALYDDQLKSLEGDSAKFGTQGEALDLALLMDGLASEREQGITIDVAYRFFSTGKRKFIVADTPGHEQYTRNMATGASTADVAILLIDARKGILSQTKRHTFIVSLLGIRHVVLAVNKMDLMGFSEKVFRKIEDDFREFAKAAGVRNVTAIPVSALNGDNVAAPSAHMAWYHGSTLLGYLETVEVDEDHMRSLPFRMAVQWVNRPDMNFRGYAGMISSGSIHPGDRIRVQPSGRETRIARIVGQPGDAQEAVAGQSVLLTLQDEVDVSRGDMLVAADSPAAVADQFECNIVWMSADAMLPGRPYLLKSGTRVIGASVTEIKYKISPATLEHVAAKKLEMNDIAVCNIALDQAIAFDPYTENRDTGSFILIDRIDNGTCGAGMLHFPLRRSQNIHRQALDVDKVARAGLKRQKPCVLWFTGLSGAGKSTIANLVEKRLFASGYHTYLLDGDNVRHGLNRDLGFTDADRVENIRRVAEVSKLMVDAGLIVLTAFISPFRAERRMARRLFADGEFVEVFVDTPLETAEGRDPKGLYKKARRGELKNFTGIDSPYEEPEGAEIHLRTQSMSPDDAASLVIQHLKSLQIISVSKS